MNHEHKLHVILSHNGFHVKETKGNRHRMLNPEPMIDVSKALKICETLSRMKKSTFIGWLQLHNMDDWYDTDGIPSKPEYPIIIHTMSVPDE